MIGTADPVVVGGPPDLNQTTGALVKWTHDAWKGDALVAAVDGERRPSSSRAPLLLTPGTHELTVSFLHGSFVGATSVKAELRAGVVYSVRGQLERPCRARVWLEEAGTEEAGTGVTVGQPQYLDLGPVTTGIPKYDLAMVITQAVTCP
ncbi:MAG: hypothetical protein JO255_17810 [Alphaproteobacteria bacterium]|nr:hypothetical protein [Alphaproteobacteria bacterium]